MIPFDERVKGIFSALQTTPHRFATEHGFNRVSMYNLINPDRKPGLDTLERICQAEPRISAEYLLRGEGEPLRDPRATQTLGTVEALRDFQSQMNDFVEKRIGEISGLPVK